MTFEISKTLKISRSENTKSRSHSPEAKIKSRHIQVLLLLLGFLCYCGIKVVPAIGLIAMTRSSTANPNIEVYNWSQSIQNLILSSFLWGFIVTEIPAGELAQRFNAKNLLGFAVGICGIVTMLIPFIVRYGGWQSVIVIRIFTGAVLGVVPPCIYNIMSKWVPVEERGRAGSGVYSGGLLGNVIALLSGGAISKSVLGWPSCFYIWGGIPILWAIIYYIFGKESPSAHSTISFAEKQYIENSLGVTVTDKILKTPWKAILTSIPFWALLVTQCAYNLGSWMILTKIPTYMANVLGYDILQNGIVMAIPYFVACLVSFPISYICDKIVKDGHVSLTAMRKIANSVGLFVPAFGLVGLSFVSSEHRTFAVAIFIACVGFNACICSGFLINHVDLSPNFSGVLVGIINTAAKMFGMIAPLICGVVVSDVTNIYQWREVFFLIAGVYISGNIVFVLFGDATVQPWNNSITHLDINTNSSTIPNVTTLSGNADDEEKNDEYEWSTYI